MTIPRRFSFRTLVSIFTLGALLALSVPRVQAQEMTPVAPPYWTTHFNSQMTKVLTSSDANLQEEGLHTLLVLMSQETPNIDFRALAPAVTQVFLNNRAPDGLRIMALSALDAMDSRGSYETLLEWARNKAPSSKRLRRHVLVILKTYQDRHGIA